MEKLKRIVFVLAMVSFIFLMFAGLTSAYVSLREVSQKTIDSFVDVLEPVLQAVFGGTTWSGLLLFEKLLVFIIFMSLVFLAIGQIPVFAENSKVRWTIAIIVPLIGVRFLDYEWLMAIILQYKLLAIVMTAILPFIIYFFFLYRISGEYDILRKIGWIFFIVVYLGLWATSEENAHADIYLYTMLASLLFLLFDGTIHRYYLKQEMKEAGAENVYQYIAKIDRDIDEIRNSNLPQRIKDRYIKKKEKHRQKLLKNL